MAGYFGINPPGYVAQVVALAFGLAAASFFPEIVMGIFSTRINKEGAIAEKEAHLVAIGTSAAVKCQYCIPYHISELKRLVFLKTLNKIPHATP